MTLFLAFSEAAAEPPGDAYATAALVFLGIFMVAAFVSTYIVTPKGGSHH